MKKRVGLIEVQKPVFIHIAEHRNAPRAHDSECRRKCAQRCRKNLLARPQAKSAEGHFQCIHPVSAADSMLCITVVCQLLAQRILLPDPGCTNPFSNFVNCL